MSPDPDLPDSAVISERDDRDDSVVSPTSTDLVSSQRVHLSTNNFPTLLRAHYQILSQMVTGVMKKLLLPVTKRKTLESICATFRVII